jgi:hypothetical protein
MASERVARYTTRKAAEECRIRISLTPGSGGNALRSFLLVPIQKIGFMDTMLDLA